MKTRFIVSTLSLTQEKVFDLHSFGGALLVTEKGRSALASAKHCEGQQQTPQSVIKQFCGNVFYLKFIMIGFNLLGGLFVVLTLLGDSII
jgi:hypothetical protein